MGRRAPLREEQSDQKSCSPGEDVKEDIRGVCLCVCARARRKADRCAETWPLGHCRHDENFAITCGSLEALKWDSVQKVLK